MPKLQMLRPKLAPPRDRGFADARRGSAAARGYGWEWAKLVQMVRARDADLCQVCLQLKLPSIGTYSAVDHTRPKSRGGTDQLHNLQVICREHHRAKTAAEAAGREWVPEPRPGRDRGA